MVQTKKPEVRDAILAAATAQFRRHGYAGASLTAIARAAGISPSNVYVYFAGKLDMLFALAGPWLLARMAALEAEAATLPTPRARLLRLFTGLWAELPADAEGFAPLLLEALATRGPEEPYSRDLLATLEARFAAALAEALPEAAPARTATTARLAFMAFDGFAVNRRLAAPGTDATDAAALMCDLLLGAEATTTPASAASRRSRGP